MSHEDLAEALAALSAAHGPAALASAHEALRRAQQRKRKGEKTKYGPLATAIKECLEIRDQMKAAGETGAELDAGLEAVVREKWPRQREEPWHYVCERCNDTGAEFFECPAQPCDREQRHGPHSFLRPCWCAKGRRFQEKQAPTEADAMERAAKPQKPTRWGR